MAANPIMLVHGYSAEASAFDPWKSIISRRGFDPSTLAAYVCSFA